MPPERNGDVPRPERYRSSARADCSSSRATVKFGRLAAIERNRALRGQQGRRQLYNAFEEGLYPFASHGRDRERPVGNVARSVKIAARMQLNRARVRVADRPSSPSQTQHVGDLDQVAAALDTQGLDHVPGLAQPSRIGQDDGHAGNRQRHIDMVAGRPRNIGDDRSLGPNYRIEKAGFSRVWRPAMTTRTPSRSGSIRGRSSQSDNSNANAAQSLESAGELPVPSSST